MKKLLAVSVAALFAVGIVACGESPTEAYAPQFELVDPTKRVAEADVNARVWLSFAIPFEVEVPGGGAGVMVPVAQPNGPAQNFPGDEKNAGSCEDGTWKNKNGKGMGGTLDKPHPHCTIYVDEGGSSIETINVVLEPISAHYFRHNVNQWRLAFTNETGDNGKVLVKNNDKLEGNGELVAWAVFEHDPSQRVGQITIKLTQFDDSVWDDEVCTVADDLEDILCLAQLIDFSYAPVGAGDGGFGVDGFGEAGDYEEAGFLYWESVGPGWYRND